MLAFGVMLLAICAFVAAGLCFITGAGWVALALVMVSMALEATAFVLAAREEAEG
mgnify:CR=1 FL=1